MLRFRFMLTIILLPIVYSCFSKVTISPDKFYEHHTKDVKEITVVKTDGSEEVFIDGWLEKDSFKGVDYYNQIKTIPLSSISHFKLKIFDGKSTSIATIGVLSMFLTAGLTVSIIAAHTSRPPIEGSCPRVYVPVENEWILDAEPLSGALTRSGEFTDYSILHNLRSVNGKYKIRYNTDSNEIDFTNELKLITVDHDPSVEIFVEESGKIVAFQNPSVPFQILSTSGRDITNRIDQRGNIFWEGEPLNIDTGSPRPREELYLKFNIPKDSKEIKFLLEGSNTFWALKMMDEFFAKFGSAARKKMEKIEKEPDGNEKLKRFMRKNGMKIEIQIKKGENWETIGFFSEAGALVPRTQIFRIPLPDNHDSQLQMKLRWGPLMWNILRIAADFSINTSPPLTIKELSPIRAIDFQKGDILAKIKSIDNDYYESHPHDRSEIEFASQGQEAGTNRTVILKTTGYYYPIISSGEQTEQTEIINMIFKKKGVDNYSLEKIRKKIANINLGYH